MHTWLSAPDLGELAGIAGPNAQKALRRAYEGGHPWRGASLVVRRVIGRGGRSGLVYQVRADSLPIELQHELNALQSGFQAPLIHGAEAAASREWWLFILSPLLRTAKHSPERAAAIREIAGREHFRDGARVTVSERTIARKLDAYERNGFAGLSRPKRVDAGERRIVLSKRWDKAVPFDDATKRRIADKLTAYIGGLVKGGEAAAVIEQHGARELAERTIAAGFDPGEAELKRICKIPGNLIQAQAKLRNVYTFKNDAKTWHDQRPSVTRTIAGVPPMGIVVGDIHPVDIFLRRDDGSIATPKAIAWLDVGTQRVWIDLVLLAPGKGHHERPCHRQPGPHDAGLGRASAPLPR
jgi:hypothetical protein